MVSVVLSQALYLPFNNLNSLHSKVYYPVSDNEDKPVQREVTSEVHTAHKGRLRVKHDCPALKPLVFSLCLTLTADLADGSAAAPSGSFRRKDLPLPS